MFRKDSKYFRLGLTLLTVIILSVLFYLFVNNIGLVFSVLKRIISVFSFVIFGIVFAYLMNPVLKLVEGLLQKLLNRSNMTERSVRKLSRSLGVAASLIVFFAVIYGLLAMVIPQLWESITETLSSENLQNYYTKITTWLNNTVRDTPLEDWLQAHDPVKAVQDWLSKELDIFSTLGSAFTEVYGVAKVIVNMIIGIVVAVYLLGSKEKYIAQFKKFIVAVFRPKGADRVFEIGRLANQSFGGFLVGKVIDALIIGVLSYIGMVILRLPYPLLSSALVGFFNIIPFFGPLIGIVPAALLILLQSPLQCLYFLIFEIILQQVDANIIGPRILGGRLGISDFWILFAITIFSALFGFPGMVLGVPAFAVIYTLAAQAINNALRKKQLTEKTEDYYSILTVEDLAKYNKEFSEPTVFFSGDSFETEYDPDDDFEFDDPEED